MNCDTDSSNPNHGQFLRPISCSVFFHSTLQKQFNELERHGVEISIVLFLYCTQLYIVCTSLVFRAVFRACQPTPFTAVSVESCRIVLTTYVVRSAYQVIAIVSTEIYLVI